MATTRGTTGFYDVDTTFGQAEQKRDVEDQIYLLDPDANPLVAFTGKNSFGQRKINSRKFEWYSDQDRAIKTTTTTTGTGTTLNVASGTGINFVPGDLIYLPEWKEVCHVDAVTSDALTVTRDFDGSVGSGTGATLAGTTSIINIGPAHGEKAALPDDIFVNPTNNYNYAQLWIESVILTKDVLNAQYFGYGGSGESVRKHEHRKHVIRYNKQREYQAYFGNKGTHATTSYPSTDSGQIFMTGGMRQAITSNCFDFGGAALTESLLLSKTKDMFRYGNHQRKALICSPQMSARMSSWGLNSIQLSQAGTGTWGFKITEWQTPHGVLEVIPCWLLSDVSTAQTYDGDWFLVADMGQIKQAVMEPTTLEMEKQNSESIRTVKDVYQGISGWQWGIEKYHCEGYGWV